MIIICCIPYLAALCTDKIGLITKVQGGRIESGHPVYYED